MTVCSMANPGTAHRMKSLKTMRRLTALKRTCWRMREGPVLSQARNLNPSTAETKSLGPPVCRHSRAVLVEEPLCSRVTTLCFHRPFFKGGWWCRILPLGSVQLEEDELAKPAAAWSAPDLSMHILAPRFLGFPEQLSQNAEKAFFLISRSLLCVALPVQVKQRCTLHALHVPVFPPR